MNDDTATYFIIAKYRMFNEQQKKLAKHNVQQSGPSRQTEERTELLIEIAVLVDEYEAEY